MEKNNSRFSRFANFVAAGSGRSVAFSLAILSMALWFAAGSSVGYGEEWKEWFALYMSAVTFLLVFLIQHSQNRAMMAVHLKLDELIRAHHGAHTSLLKAEHLSDSEMDRLSENYNELAETARDHISVGRTDTHTPEMDLVKKETSEE